MSNNKLAASQRNTVLDDIVAVIGLRATVLLAAWWGGRNIVVPDSRPERSVIARVIGEEAARRLSAAYPAEQIFIPRLNWFEEVRKARQVYNLRARGFAFDEIAQLMVLTKREVEDMAEVGRFAAEAVAMERADRRGPQLFDLELPQVRGGRGGQPSKRASRAAKNGGGHDMRATRNDLPPSIATTADLLRAVIACAGRGTVQEAGLGAVIVRVPFYRVRRIRAALGTRLPATIRLDVRRLTLRQHFTLWGACALPAPNLGDKP